MDKLTGEFYSRTRLLAGEDGCAKLAGSTVLVLGTGGVGGSAVEALVRAGVGKLILADGDAVDSSNRNRQLSALISTIGKPKAQVWCERCREINPAGEFIALERFFRTAEDIETLFSGKIDFAIDAIDEIGPKIDFITALKLHDIPFVSSMGAGGKLDAGAICAADISKTSGCPLARSVRQRLREKGISKGVRVIYSPEVPQKRFADKKIGAISYIPMIFGCFCASEAILNLIGKKNA